MGCGFINMLHKGLDRIIPLSPSCCRVGPYDPGLCEGKPLALHPSLSHPHPQPSIGGGVAGLCWKTRWRGEFFFLECCTRSTQTAPVWCADSSRKLGAQPLLCSAGWLAGRLAPLAIHTVHKTPAQGYWGDHELADTKRLKSEIMR